MLKRRREKASRQRGIKKINYSSTQAITLL
jgi:hypothetical protein